MSRAAHRDATMPGVAPSSFRIATSSGLGALTRLGATGGEPRLSVTSLAAGLDEADSTLSRALADTSSQPRPDMTTAECRALHPGS